MIPTSIRESWTSAAQGGVGAAIHRAAASTGVDFSYLLGQARIESGFNPNARAKTSSATGLFQFIDQTWLGTVKQHGAKHGMEWAASAIQQGANGRYHVADPAMRRAILDLRKDPGAASSMAAEFAADNQSYLENRLGRATESVDLYLAHFLGAGGAAKFLKAHDANPNASAASALPAAASANRWVFYNKNGSPRSFAEIRDRFAAKLGGASGPLPSPATRDFTNVRMAALEAPKADIARPSPQYARLAYLMLAQLGAEPMASQAVNRKLWLSAGRGAILPLATLMLVGLMVVPIPAVLLDVGFIANIMISLAILMVALNAAKPLDFSSFPTVLLFATILRLALNVASTRVVLVSGHEGPDAAGHVIEAFGNFLIGGDYAVGIFVFAILMIINLVVITKGAGRVSEVSARFTLDAMPGKQMAIDADLNAGLLTPDEAKLRRQEVATEADFYGSMDGASKFVKGDAVAGVLILVINIVGGLVLGTLSHGLTIAQAAETYLLLAIGDALVAQVPALLLSIAAASIVTRVASPLDLSGQITSQFGSPKAWAPVAAILAILGVLPGMPHFMMLTAAGLAGYLAWRLRHGKPDVQTEPEAAPPPNPSIIGWDEVSDGAALGLELGYGLIGLVDERKGAPLMARITGIRRQLSRELGFVIPLVRVRDNLALGPNSYRIIVAGVIAAEDEVWPEDLLALDSGDILHRVEGRQVKDPTFGLDAVWIAPEKRGDAVVAGYTVVDPATVVATHLNQIVQTAAADMFGMDEAQKLLDALKESAPQLVAGLTPQPLSLALIAALCRSLLAEGVPLKDFRRIAEAMVDAAREETDPNQLSEGVRQRIGGLIVQTIAPARTPLPVLTLDAELEGLLNQAVRAGKEASHPIEPNLAQKIVQSIGDAAGPALGEGRRVALVTSPVARRALSRLLAPHIPDVPVLSFLEIPDGKPVEVVAVVGGGVNRALLGAAA